MKEQLIKKFGGSNIVVSSSAGDFVISYDGVPLTQLPEEYNDVALFDIPRLEAMCEAYNIPPRNEWDILAIAYWTCDGEYEPPADDYGENGCMIYLWNGSVDEYDDAHTLAYGVV